MKMLLLVAATMLATGLAHALSPGEAPGDLQHAARPQSSREALSSKILRTWAPYVQRYRGEDADEWVESMAPTLWAADLDNLQRASRATTFEGMINALFGQRMDDDAILTQAAKMSEAEEQGADASISPASLGDTASDLVYTPLTPCRIADSRAIGAPLAAGGSVLIDSYKGAGNFLAQGGANSNCGIADNPAALSISFTALPFGSGGYMKIYPSNAVPSQGATINFIPNRGITNDVIIKSCQGCSKELGLFTSAATHYVLDVTGYFMAPVATALECGEGSVNEIVASDEFRSVSAPACASGYSAVGVNCTASTVSAALRDAKVIGSGGVCFYTNYDTSTLTTYRASVTCCRIPGR